MSTVAGRESAFMHRPSFAARFGLRFLACYALLYSWPFPLTIAPSPGDIAALGSRCWTSFVLGVARVLGIEVPALPNGSGDTTFNYVEVLVCAALALIFATAWVLLPRRVSEARWRALLVLHLRYVLALAMLGYGFAKVFPGQFAPLSLDRLNSTHGESSPMGLLWTLMGLSRPYAIFAGATEVLSGLLLLFPATAVLGALVGAAVMTNVVAMNFCFDVPVKLYSSHLLLMAIGIVLPEARRLLAAAVGRATSARARCLLAPTARGIRAVRGVHGLVLAAIAWSQWQDVRSILARDDPALASPICGLWRVDSRTVDGVVDPPTEAGSPPRVFFSTAGVVMFRDGRGHAERLRFSLDGSAETLALTSFGLPVRAEEPRLLHYSIAADTLLLRETRAGVEVVMRCARMPDRAFPLTERGFHWINEFPLNH